MLVRSRALLASLTAVALAALALAAAPAASAAVTYDDPAQKIIDLTNDIRDDAGVKDLTRSYTLEAIAQAWAEQLAENYQDALDEDPDASVPLSHNPKLGSQVPSGWSAYAENVAWNKGYNDPVSQLVKSWKNSSGHYTNMVNSRYNYVGIGYYLDSHGIAWGVQVFGQYSSNPDGASAAVTTVEKDLTADSVSLKRGNTYYVKNFLGSGTPDDVLSTGKSTDVALVGDWDGDGVDTIMLKRGNTYYVKNYLGSGAPDYTFKTGKSSDVAIVGDWDGDGVDTIMLKRGNTYYVKNYLGGGAPDYTFKTGKSSDVAVVGDWDGDGDDTIMLKRGNVYYVKNYLGGGAPDDTFKTGKSSDVVLIGDWDDDGEDTLALKRGNTYYLKNYLGGGAPDDTFSTGKSSDVALAGNFDGE